VGGRDTGAHYQVGTAITQHNASVNASVNAASSVQPPACCVVASSSELTASHSRGIMLSRTLPRKGPSLCWRQAQRGEQCSIRDRALKTTRNLCRFAVQNVYSTFLYRSTQTQGSTHLHHPVQPLTLLLPALLQWRQPALGARHQLPVVIHHCRAGRSNAAQRRAQESGWVGQAVKQMHGSANLPI
jgi:hypothetical protein